MFIVLPQINTDKKFKLLAVNSSKGSWNIEYFVFLIKIYQIVVICQKNKQNLPLNSQICLHMFWVQLLFRKNSQKKTNNTPQF